MVNVVIDGADGFIGSNLSNYLANRGIHVYAIITENSPLRYRICGKKNIHVVEGNLLNWQDLVRKLPCEPTAFLHFAWDGVAPKFRNEMIIQYKNIDLTRDAIHLAAKIRAKKFIFPGSTTEYTEYGKPINKEALPSPQNSYGAVKLACRYLCAALCEEKEIPFIYVVIAGTYGKERMDGNIIYYTIDCLLKQQRPSYTMLEQKWDYVHIDDVITALSLIIEKGRNNAFYTIGHGDNWPLSKYIYIIRDIISPGVELGVGDIPYKNDIIPSSCVDLSSLKADTGFEPKISFDVGIRDVIEAMYAKKDSK